jgi:alpha-tubulin suppressor-like RCC1 family protein
MMNQAKCTTCGAGLSFKQGDSTSVCNYCQSTNIVENALALGKVEVDVTEDIKKLRANLTTFVQQNSIDEILRVSQKLLDWIPQDFVARYFFAYSKQQQNQPRFMYDFYQSPPTYTKDEWLVVLDHIKIHSELRDRQRVLSLLANENESFRREYEEEYKIRERMEENYANIPRNVFICFSSYNESIAQEVLETLERDGHSCWISTRNLRPNDADNYWINIENAIQKASLFIVISSEEAMISKDVQQEVELAIKHHKKRFEIKIDSSKHTSLFKYAFDGVKWVDYQGLNRTKSLTERVFTELSNTKGLIKPQQESKDNFVPAQSKKRASTKPLLYLFGGLLIVALVTALIFNPFEFESSEFTPPENEIVIDISTEDEIVTEETTPIVVIDTTPPELTLIGESLITLAFGEQFSEPGAIAIDDIDGEVDVVISGSVNPEVPGEYRITYTARDASGNESVIRRNVIVEDLVEQIINVIAGGNNSYAVTNTNRVFSWGRNLNGTVGDGTIRNQLSPVDITANFIFGGVDYLQFGVKDIQAGDDFALMLLDDGGLMTWGVALNQYFGEINRSLFPTPLILVSESTSGRGDRYDFESITTNNWNPRGDFNIRTFIGYTKDNRLILFGNNIRIHPLIPNPTNSNPTIRPVDITDTLRVNDFSINVVDTNNRQGFAVINDNQVFSWGTAVSVGHSNLPNTGNITNEFQLFENEKIVDMQSGEFFTVLLTNTGRALVFGFNQFGEVFSVPADPTPKPTLVNPMINLAAQEVINKISVGKNFAVAVTTNNRVFVWGQGTSGQMGNDTRTVRNVTPIDITNYFVFQADEVIKNISSGNAHTILITSENRVFVWGSNSHGQIGDGTTNIATKPIEITTFILTKDNS